MKKKLSPKADKLRLQLQAERSRLKMSQEDVANLLEMPLRTYARIELGQTETHIVAYEGALARMKIADQK